MKEQTITKAAHYRSFYDIAKKIKNPDARLAFYEALDAYRFDGVEMQDLPYEVELVFTAIKPLLDADSDRKNGGAPAGNSNASKKQPENNGKTTAKQPKTTAETTENNGKNNQKQPEITVVFEETNNVNDNENDNVKENEDGEDNIGACAQEPPPPPLPFSEPQQNYAQLVLNKFKVAALPCANGDYFQFINGDFKRALSTLHKDFAGLSSQDVLSAIDNYIIELAKPNSYLDQKFSFDSFVASKTFRNCLPANYRPENFVSYKKQQPESDAPTKQPDFLFYQRMKNNPDFDGAVFGTDAHRAAWLAAGQPEGERYFALQAAWQAEAQAAAFNAEMQLQRTDDEASAWS